MKEIIKKITPPILWSVMRDLFLKKKVFKPIWNTLSYPPLSGIKIYFDPNGPWQKKIIENKYDTFIFERLNSYNLKDKVIYDIGAHIGFHSFYFARIVGENGKVYAFEPNPQNVERMNMILENNQDIKNIVKIFDVAISDKIGSETFSMSGDIESGRSTGGFIDSADTIWERSAFIERGFKDRKVKTFPIDKLEESLGIKDAPDLMKIDVEGAESLVLIGAKSTILSKKPIILMEVHSIMNMFNVTSFLSSISYKIEIIKEESDGRCFIEARPI